MVLRPEAVRERLLKLEEVISRLDELRLSARKNRGFRDEWAAERGLQLGAEIILDASNHILSAHFGVSAEDYEDVLRQLVKQGVIDDAMGGRLKGLEVFATSWFTDTCVSTRNGWRNSSRGRRRISPTTPARFAGGSSGFWLSTRRLRSPDRLHSRWAKPESAPAFCRVGFESAPPTLADERRPSGNGRADARSPGRRSAPSFVLELYFAEPRAAGWKCAEKSASSSLPLSSPSRPRVAIVTSSELGS